MSNRLQTLPSDLLVSKIFNVKNISACHINDIIKSLDLELTEEEYSHLIKTHFDKDFLLDFDFNLGNTLEERFQRLSESHCLKLVFTFYLYHSNTDAVIKRGRFFKRNLSRILEWYRSNWKIFRSNDEIYAMHNYANSDNKQTVLLVSTKGGEILGYDSFVDPDPDGMGPLEIDEGEYSVVGEIEDEKFLSR